MSHHETAPVAAENQADPAPDATRAASPAPAETAVQESLSGSGHESSHGFLGNLMGSSVGRNLGLVVALFILCLVGVATAGQQFASVDNALTILRLGAVIGVVTVGMTFVIIGGGIDLSVGAIVALASVWSTTLATQTMARDYHWTVIVFTAIVVGTACGLVNGLLIAYGRVVPFIATLAMLAAARGLAEIIAQQAYPDRRRPRLHRLLPCRGRWASRCWSASSRWCPSSAGSCSTAPRSADVPSRSAATRRPPGSPAST